eukprot:gene32003-39535_t
MRASERLDDQLFLNGGVFVMDAVLWRAQNLTRRAEELIAANVNGSIYSTAIGIIHFAGTTHGDAEMLCRDPLQYPVLLLSGVVPLYLSVMSAFQKKCPQCAPHSVHPICRQACPHSRSVLAECRQMN